MKVRITHKDARAYQMFNRPTRVAADWYSEEYCDDIWEQGNLVYLMRGGYVWRCESKRDVEVISA